MDDIVRKLREDQPTDVLCRLAAEEIIELRWVVEKLREENKRLKFMVDNGLGEEDMIMEPL